MRNLLFQIQMYFIAPMNSNILTYVQNHRITCLLEKHIMKVVYINIYKNITMYKTVLRENRTPYCIYNKINIFIQISNVVLQLLDF